eukprot:10905990-Ditylum_brightwellii.AAC.1
MTVLGPCTPPLKSGSKSLAGSFQFSSWSQMEEPSYADTKCSGVLDKDRWDKDGGRDKDGMDCVLG